MRTCVITGASSGIGFATAKKMSKYNMFDGYALIGRSITETNYAAEQIRDLSLAKINVYQADLNMPQNIPQIIYDIYNEFGSIDCLLNIAGYTDPQPLLTTSLESFEETYRVNVFSPFMLIRESVRYMKNTGGKILNVGSTAGITPRPGWLSYSSSKAAIISMSQTLTEELSEYGIKVYCISPGRCATKLRKRLAPDEDPTTIMQPEDVADVICNLISTKESCLDGQNIIIRKKI